MTAAINVHRQMGLLALAGTLLAAGVAALVFGLLSQQAVERDGTEDGLKQMAVIGKTVQGCTALLLSVKPSVEGALSSEDMERARGRWGELHEELTGRLQPMRSLCGNSPGDETTWNLLGKVDQGIQEWFRLTSLQATGEVEEIREDVDRDIAALQAEIRSMETRALQVLSVELENTRRESQRVLYRYAAGVCVLSGLTVFCFLWTYRSVVKMFDTTERLHRELQGNQAQLVHSEKMAGLGQIAAGVAHEINNPVGFIMSNLGTLTGYVSTFKGLLDEYQRFSSAFQEGRSGEAAEILARIQEIIEKEDLDYVRKDVDQLLSESAEGTHRIKEIVQSLKSFAHIDEAQVKEANVNDCIETTLKVIWNELKYKCKVLKRLGDLPPIRCYPGQLNQVFMNLLINAAQAIPERGEIRIETEASDKDVIVRISDTGTGIPEENLAKLFTPFFSTKPVGKGTGLGLSIAFGIIQKHGGRIDARSTVGKGTTFTIHLPLRGGGDCEP
ncbi:MAG: hypothetical protein HY608_07460 [Planctomycetes bacterium]|nr:hypothetical protein [Planctomycetota bacterium]